MAGSISQIVQISARRGREEDLHVVRFSCAPPAAGGGLAVPLRWPRDAWTVGVRLCGRWSGHVVAAGLGLSAEKPLGKEGRSCVES